MLSWLRRRPSSAEIAHKLYGSSVASARAPWLYLEAAVPDTLEGRFELVMLHVALLLARLRAEGEPGLRLGQEVMEAMFEALDDDMREQGVGDLTVPKKMHKAAGAFLGRASAYAAALAEADDAALTAALARNVYGGDAATGAAERLAGHVRVIAQALAAEPAAALLAGDVRFPSAAAAS